MEKKQTRLDRVAVACINTLILLVAALLFCGLLYAAKPRNLWQNDTALTYTVKLTAVRAEYTGDIHVGDTVLDAIGKREIGRVTAFSITPAMTETYSRRENRMRMVEYPGRVTVTLTIAAEARGAEGGYTIAGFPLHRGRKTPLRLPNFVGTGVCTKWEATPLS